MKTSNYMLVYISNYVFKHMTVPTSNTHGSHCHTLEDGDVRTAVILQWFIAVTAVLIYLKLIVNESQLCHGYTRCCSSYVSPFVGLTTAISHRKHGKLGYWLLIGWGNGGNVTSAGWQVTLCDPIWHASSRSGAVLVAQTAIRFLTLPYLILWAIKAFGREF